MAPLYMLYMEKIEFSGSINPARGEARFPEKMDKQGRIPVPRMVRDKLGIQGKEARIDVSITVVEIYKNDD